MKFFLGAFFYIKLLCGQIPEFLIPPSALQVGFADELLEMIHLKIQVKVPVHPDSGFRFLEDEARELHQGQLFLLAPQAVS